MSDHSTGSDQGNGEGIEPSGSPEVLPVVRPAPRTRLSAEEVGLMPLGDHLEELRKRLIWGMVGLAVPLVLGLKYWRPIMEFLLEPANAALHREDLAPAFQVTTFFELFNSALKLSFIIALIAGGPWLLYQLWLFIAPGLYKHERRYAYIVGPLSMLLTICSGLFMYYAMLPVVLAFFVGFNGSLRIHTAPPKPLPSGVTLAPIPILAVDPEGPAPGTMWVNTGLNQLRIAVGPAKVDENAKGEGAKEEQAKKDSKDNGGDKPVPTVDIRGIWLTGGELVSQQYRIADYVSMIFGFGLAFAAGFQMPVAVLLLGWAHIVNVKLLTKYRKHAIMVCAILGAVLTPADPISMLVMAVPLYLLFELGVILLRVLPASRVAGKSAQEDHDTHTSPAPGRGESQEEPPDA